MKKQDGWYVRRPYKHFDLPANYEQALALVSDPQKISKHEFYPFLAYEKAERQLRKVLTANAGSTKKRPIAYAGHHDGYIFSYYAKQLNDLYEARLRQLDLQEYVIAYRQSKGSNIDFARDSFDEIERRQSCVAITLDISSFFASIDHAVLKAQWCVLLDQKMLPADHYAVFRAISKYSQANRDACLEALGIDERKQPARLVKDAREYREKIRGNKLIETNRAPFGIPQGSPISALLSNIYMLPFDEEVAREAKRIGAYYRRYSDDILLICSEQHKDQLIDFVTDHIKKLGSAISINSDKTTISSFAVGADGKLGSSGDRFQYLGFEFDGQRRLIRAQTVSRYWRKVTYSVRSAKRKARKIAKAGGSPVVFKRKLYRKFSHLGSTNFIQYAYRADKVVTGGAIKKQVSKHWNRLNAEINKPLDN